MEADICKLLYTMYEADVTSRMQRNIYILDIDKFGSFL